MEEKIDTHSKEHSEICFCDNQIVDWLRNYVSYNKVGYDKLERPHGKTDNTGGVLSETLKLTEGLFSISGVPVNLFLTSASLGYCIYKRKLRSSLLSSSVKQTLFLFT